MGIDYNSARFLIRARRAGMAVDRVLTFGRQGYFLTPRQRSRVAAALGVSGPARWQWGEDFFRALGAAVVDSIDASDFEGANLIHDLNEPIPDAWKGKYDLVFDGGCLEHVCNFPEAIRGGMEMVKVGGHFLAAAPANNFCGHGFYQFSPELYFRRFAPANGFVVRELVLVEQGVFSNHAYRVSDPTTVGARMNLINARPVTLLMRAERTAPLNGRLSAPHQSDYVAAWAPPPANPPPPSQHTGWLRAWAERFYHRCWVSTLRHRKMYQPLRWE